jgi:superfamily II DNA/RNA helicase
MADASSITALLGPTNTGKTHRAVERMLDHDSGMIGLPLRLLAREVYDRVSTRVGEGRVALVTGEEKRVPRRPDYWVCTVEAMPVSREVDFLAVDEVQLAAHEQRGHVFTERVLHARGRKETWFLGSDAARGVMEQLCPAAKVTGHPRLSRLSLVDPLPLQRLPPRSAVVAFSLPQVYELAERLRIARGGAAVVLGALSPRTRNAQVAMFEAGEVDYLVATDAIGMGLNLDVRHVAFASLRKFDGRAVRDVDVAELAQIAGRAGRYVRDGTFNTVAPLQLPRDVARAIEQHRVPALRAVQWRNADLDFDSLDALLARWERRAPVRMAALVALPLAAVAHACGGLAVALALR